MGMESAGLRPFLLPIPLESGVRHRTRLGFGQRRWESENESRVWDGRERDELHLSSQFEEGTTLVNKRKY